MKKIPTLFKRVFDENHKKSITEEVTPGCEWVLRGEGLATIKYDGACCAIIGGEIYKRYDAKQKYGKKPPEGAIPCQPEPDPITGHWPHWVRCEKDKPEDKYFIEACKSFKTYPIFSVDPAQRHEGNGNFSADSFLDGTYEAVGPAWQSNPYGLAHNRLFRHGDDVIHYLWLRDDGKEDKFAFNKIKGYLQKHEIEGIVFWKDGEPQCKIKRSDFGFEWPIKKGGQ